VTLATSPAVTSVDGTAAVLRDVTVAYGARVALDHVDLTIARGSLMAVIGPNGAGKSTLLKAIAGLVEPVSGTLEVLGGPPGREARRLAYVPQAEVVDWGFPVTVGDIAMMGRVPLIGIGRSPGLEDRAAVHEALATVGMIEHERRQIGALSGGQRRRVFLARALAARPDLFLLDEPVTGVDATTEEDLMRVLEAEVEGGSTVIASTHDLAAAAHHFHEVTLINRRVVATGPSSLLMDRELLRETYGGHVVVLPEGETTIIDDAHHHDDAPAGERHFHEGRG
jgi:manganese/zinc/iron transport system ATP- binding protein